MWFLFLKTLYPDFGAKSLSETLAKSRSLLLHSALAHYADGVSVSLLDYFIDKLATKIKIGDIEAVSTQSCP